MSMYVVEFVGVGLEEKTKQNNTIHSLMHNVGTYNMQ